MKQLIPQEFSTKLIDWYLLLIMGNTVPPRDPEEEEEEDDNAGIAAPTMRPLFEPARMGIGG